MSLRDSLTSRENEIVNILSTIYNDRNKKFALIGGYAVDAYSILPRYSADCDIVISKDDLGSFSATFAENGFKDAGSTHRIELDGIETRKYIKQVGASTVSVDLLVEGVRCRQTEATWKYEEIQQASKQLRVIGVNSSVLSNVASKELLIAMKLHSGRDTDLKDVVMIIDSANWTEVLRFANRGEKGRVISQLQKAIKQINGQKFEEQLKSFFGSRKKEKTRINLAIAEIASLLTKMEVN